MENNLPRHQRRNLKGGLFGIGLDTYWPQPAGLKEKLEGYQTQIRQQLESFGAEVVNLGLVDNPLSSRAVGDRFRAENVESVSIRCAEIGSMPHTQ